MTTSASSTTSFPFIVITRAPRSTALLCGMSRVTAIAPRGHDDNRRRRRRWILLELVVRRHWHVDIRRTIVIERTRRRQWSGHLEQRLHVRAVPPHRDESFLEAVREDARRVRREVR